MNSATTFPLNAFSFGQDDVKAFADQHDTIKALRSDLQRLESWSETLSTQGGTHQAVEAATRIVATLDAHPFLPDGQFYRDLLLSNAVSNQNKTRLATPATQQLLQRHSDRLRDDAVQLVDAIAAISEDPEFAAVCQAGAWAWAHVVLVKRCGVAFSDVVTSAPLAAPTPLTGGSITPTFKVDFGGDVGVRVFKANEPANRADAVRAFLEPLALCTLARILASSRLDALVRTKLPNNVAARYPSLVGDCKLAIVRIGSVDMLGTAMPFFGEPFVLAQIDRKHPPPNSHRFLRQLILNVDLDDLDIRRQATCLQQLDFVAGAVDRHNGNIMVSHETSDVRGIDSDFGWSHLTTGLPARLPPVFDKEFSLALHAISQQELAAAAQGLSVLEVDAAWARLQAHQVGYNAAPPEAHAVIDNAVNNERTWAQTNESEFVRIPGPDQHYVYRLYSEPRRAPGLNRPHSSIVRHDGFACISLTDDPEVPFFLFSRETNNNSGTDLPVANRITLGQGGARGARVNN